MRFWYPASITDITEINESFDSCLLTVCYAGRNRNKSNLPKEVIERAIPTMAYCPIVANYDIESDTIGGHDVDIVKTDDGSMKMVNLTDAVGVIPGEPQWYWDERTEEDGSVHEYLCTPAILWKRTPVYQKLKSDGVSGQSMEISIKNGKMVDGEFVVEDFQFTAFCLLGDDVEPCFESAAVTMFSSGLVHGRLHEMMDDFKKEFQSVMAASADDINTPNGEQEQTMKGGDVTLNIEELMNKYQLTSDDITFSLEGMTEEEIEAKFAELHAAKFDGEGDQDGAPEADEHSGGSNDNENADPEETEPEEDDNEDAPGGTKQFSLTADQLRNEIMNALYQNKMRDEWGEFPRYCYVDHDDAVSEVYAYDNSDWNLYGLKYSMNGDYVVIDFESAKRKKLAFVDFDMGDMEFSYKHIMDGAQEKFDAMTKSLDELKQYKLSVENDKRESELKNIFSQFADLEDDERFAALKTNCTELSVQDIEDKCYAIRGRKMQMQFSRNEDKPTKLPVERGNGMDGEPYGGVFLEYGIGK